MGWPSESVELGLLRWLKAGSYMQAAQEPSSSAARSTLARGFCEGTAGEVGGGAIGVWVLGSGQGCGARPKQSCTASQCTDAQQQQVYSRSSDQHATTSRGSGQHNSPARCI